MPDAPDSFEARVRQVIDDYLNDPVFRLPSGFKQWLPPFIELSGIQLPADSVPGSRVITSLDAVPDGNSGQLVTLRAGSSPYHFLQLTYDSTYQRWVSSQVWYSFWVYGGQVEIVYSTYSDIPSGIIGRIAIPGFANFYSAGLRPQVYFYSRLVVEVTATASTRTVSSRLAIREISNNDGSYSNLIATTPTELSLSMTTVGTVDQFKTSVSFVDFSFSNAPSKETGVIVMQAKLNSTSSANAYISDGAIALRWVSA